MQLHYNTVGVNVNIPVGGFQDKPKTHLQIA